MLKLFCLSVVIVSSLLAACSKQSTDLSVFFNQQTATSYQCDNQQKIVVYYSQQQGNDLAWLELPQQSGKLFVNVLSASGAKYVADSYVWWTKGNEATLSDLTQPDNKNLSCHVISQ